MHIICRYIGVSVSHTLSIFHRCPMSVHDYTFPCQIQAPCMFYYFWSQSSIELQKVCVWVSSCEPDRCEHTCNLCRCTVVSLCNTLISSTFVYNLLMQVSIVITCWQIFPPFLRFFSLPFPLPLPLCPSLPFQRVRDLSWREKLSRELSWHCNNTATLNSSTDMVS